MSPSELTVCSKLFRQLCAPIETFVRPEFIRAVKPPIHTCPSSLFCPAIVEGSTTCLPLACTYGLPIRKVLPDLSVNSPQVSPWFKPHSPSGPAVTECRL